MDFETNIKFFDLKHRKKVRIMKRIGMPITVVGALMVVLGSFGMWAMMMAGWPLLIVSVPIVAIASSWNVKENDILDLVEEQKKEFKQYCEEKLDYPGDLAANAILLTGCDAACQKDNGLPTKKLKSGAMLAPVVTFTYLYIKRDRLVIFTRYFAITEDYVEDKKQEVFFSEFDKVAVVAADNGDCKGFAFRISAKDEVVFSAPVLLEDYTIDSYAQNILHTKDRAGRR